MRYDVRKRILLMMVVLSLVLCTACGSKQDTQQDYNLDSTSEVEETTEEVADLYPMTVVDQAGREVVIQSKPTSLVSIYYISTSALLALDLKDEIKGIESNPEKRNLYNLCAPELLQITQVGSPKEFDIEACASLSPDLVILPLRSKDMVASLEELGITVIVVNPESQADVLEMIQLIGKITDRADRALELTDYIQSKIDFLHEKVGEADAPAVYLGGNSSFFSTASKGMYQNDLISMAGGKNVAGDIDDTYWVEVSYEQILEWDPEYVIAASAASYTLDEIQNDSDLAYCQAVSNHNLYKMPSDIEDWDSPVPGSFLGAVYLSSVLHPELVSKEQYEDMVKEYYETFYGFSYTEE